MLDLGFLKELTLTGAGVWTLVILAAATFIKAWTPLKQLSITESQSLRDDRRRDYKELRGEMDIVKLRSAIVERHSTAVDVRLGQLEFILGMTLDELDKQLPGNEVAKKAREMFGRLYPVPPISQELEAIKHSLDPLHSPIGQTV